MKKKTKESEWERERERKLMVKKCSFPTNQLTTHPPTDQLTLMAQTSGARENFFFVRQKCLTFFFVFIHLPNILLYISSKTDFLIAF